MKYLIRILVWVIGSILLIVIGFMLISTFMKYKPDKIEVLNIHPPALKKQLPLTKDEFTFLTWNIGYAGLGQEMDFFYEGGKMVRPTSVQNQRYLTDILKELKGADTVDFIFIQEVDKHAKRTFYTDEVDAFQKQLNDYYSVFAVNYDVPFVPIPLMEPMGRVKAGQMTFSRMVPDSALRYALQGSYSWPKRLFLLDRCFIYTRYTLPSGKTLSLINLHNSAFSDAAQARQNELKLLKSLMTDLYKQGNYVIVGGDWNQNPPGFNPDLITDGNKAYAFEHVPLDFIPSGWRLATDKTKASNRNVNESYKMGRTLTTTIDFFMVSPNVDLESVQTVTNGFVNSDHQPVVMKVKLK